MRATKRNVGLGAILLTALVIIPYCAQSRIDRAALDQAAIDRADRNAAGARDAASRAQKGAAEAAAAAKAARHAVDDLQPPDGPGS